MKFEYKRIDISTVDGIKRAERLKANGWKIISTGLFSLLMESPTKRK
jgi:hypothetical protein